MKHIDFKDDDSNPWLWVFVIALILGALGLLCAALWGWLWYFNLAATAVATVSATTPATSTMPLTLTLGGW